MVIIGKTFNKMRLNLIDEINKGTLKVLDCDEIESSIFKKTGNFCYLCRKSSKLRKKILIRESFDEIGIAEYFVVDNICYAKSKGVYLV